MVIALVTVFGENQPVTWATFNMLTQLRDAGGSVGDLRFYLSKPLNIIILDEHNEIPEIAIRDGGLVSVGQGRSSSSIILDDSIEGRLISFPVSGSDIIDIIFYTDSGLILLRFRRSEQHDSFVVFSATVNTRVYALHSQTELPQLLIRSAVDRGTYEAYAYLLSLSGNQPSGNQTGGNQASGNQTGTIVPGNRNDINQQGARTGLILGAGASNVNNIVTYIRTQNPFIDQNTERLIELYISEALIENINHDIAIAQMLHATNFLRNQQRVNNHNYAGFSPTVGWNGSFNSMNEGVRAHIQHLKGYASGEPLKNTLVAPRYNILASSGLLGTVRDFDDLYRAWSLNSVNYKNSIEVILDGLYR